MGFIMPGAKSKWHNNNNTLIRLVTHTHTHTFCTHFLLYIWDEGYKTLNMSISMHTLRVLSADRSTGAKTSADCLILAQ